MIPVTMTEVGVDNPRANCFMACVASILEVPLESLPDLYTEEQAGRNWWQVFVEVLALRGMQPVEGVRDGYFIAIGPSPRSSVPHAVVMRGEEIVHDPHPSRQGLATEPTYCIAMRPI